MILVDTSVWADHLSKGDARLRDLLNDSLVLMHPFVLGEISLGNLKPRNTVLDALASLPMARNASDDEVMTFIETSHLFGTAIGLIDVNLLASAKLEAATIWTRDKRLRRQATRLGLCFE